MEFSRNFRRMPVKASRFGSLQSERALMSLSELISDAKMSFGFIEGTGLGAVLLAIVTVVFLLRSRRSSISLPEILKQIRPGNEGRGTELVSKADDGPAPQQPESDSNR